MQNVEAEKACLTCVLGDQKKFVFTDYEGKKVMERSAIGFALALKNEQMKMIEDIPLVDRVIDNLVDELGPDSH